MCARSEARSEDCAAVMLIALRRGTGLQAPDHNIENAVRRLPPAFASPPLRPFESQGLTRVRPTPAVCPALAPAVRTLSPLSVARPQSPGRRQKAILGARSRVDANPAALDSGAAGGHERERVGIQDMLLAQDSRRQRLRGIAVEDR